MLQTAAVLIIAEFSRLTLCILIFLKVSSFGKWWKHRAGCSIQQKSLLGSLLGLHFRYFVAPDKDVCSTSENNRGLKILKLVLVAKMLINNSINDEKIPHCRHLMSKMVGVILATEVKWLSPTRHQLELYSLHFSRGAISTH